jgi:hypothetical protein
MLVTRTGRIVLLECKLWRNPQARREVVGQILDYAKELARWDYARLQAALADRLGKAENPLFTKVALTHQNLDEARFVDGVERTLREGRFLLLIAGDGIQQGARAIVEYLQEHATLRFSLGLVEVRGYRLPDGRMLIQPRILARTEIIERNVIVQMFRGQESLDTSPAAGRPTIEPSEMTDGDDSRIDNDQDRKFFDEFSKGLKFADPGQDTPVFRSRNSARAKIVASEIWVNAYRSKRDIGVQLRLKGAIGRAVYEALSGETSAIDAEFAERLPGNVGLDWFDEKDDISTIQAVWRGASNSASERDQLDWLARACVALVDTFRSRIQTALNTIADAQDRK